MRPHLLAQALDALTGLRADLLEALICVLPELLQALVVSFRICSMWPISVTVFRFMMNAKLMKPTISANSS